MAEPELLTTAQVLSMLQIGRTKLWELVRRGAFPAYRLGEGRSGPLRFRGTEISRWLDHNRVSRREPPPEATAGANRE